MIEFLNILYYNGFSKRIFSMMLSKTIFHIPLIFFGKSKYTLLYFWNKLRKTNYYPDDFSCKFSIAQSHILQRFMPRDGKQNEKSSSNLNWTFKNLHSKAICSNINHEIIFMFNLQIKFLVWIFLPLFHYRWYLAQHFWESWYPFFFSLVRYNFPYLKTQNFIF